MTRRTSRRRGFTLVEMACATVLTGLIGVLCALAWLAFGVPAVDAYHQNRLAAEARLAAASIAADLAGSLPRPFSPIDDPDDDLWDLPEGASWGRRDEGRLAGWQAHPGFPDGMLTLQYTVPGPLTPHLGEFVEVSYRVVLADPIAGRKVLQRTDTITNAPETIAGDVDSLEVVFLSPHQLIFNLHFRYRNPFGRRTEALTYQFEAITP